MYHFLTRSSFFEEQHKKTEIGVDPCLGAPGCFMISCSAKITLVHAKLENSITPA